ncbi:hypothetical protein B0H12DRAFT_1014217, partial [Mycena haematopus]
WMRDGHAMLVACEGGEGWLETVAQWTQLERAYGFKTSTKALPTEGRPSAVHKWSKYGRNPQKAPVLDDNFPECWWGWWSALAPTWRPRNSAGHPEAGSQGPWGALVHPGANGMLMVLLALAWWRDSEATASESWMEALKDVGWVLSSLLTSAR